MMGATVWTNQTTQPASFPIESGKGSPIARLIEDPEVKKAIKFDELSFNYPTPNAASNTFQDISKNFGVLYPVIRINDEIFAINNISYMCISSDGFIPTISLELLFTQSNFVTKSMPKDGDIISTYISSNTSSLNYLRNDFIVTSCNTSMGTRLKTKYTISLQGKLFIPGFESDYNLFANIGSSKTVCKETAKRFGLGFAFNDSDDTTDFQNWICSGNTSRFIGDVTQHSWKNNISFFDSWIDLYYNICFVNVNKFLLSSNKEDIDITFASAVSMYQGLAPNASHETAENSDITIKLFSNIDSIKGSPFYITDWHITNNSGLSIKNGYTDESYTFIHNQYLYSSTPDSCFSILDNITAYDKDKTDSYMVLRGRTTYDAKNTTERARVNYNMPELYKTRNYVGVEYTLSDDTDQNSNTTDNWAGNVHKNYLRAPLHNSINKLELNKLYITIETDGLCLQVMRGERVPVYLEQAIAANADQLSGKAVNTSKGMYRMYSGYYIVDSIQYKYNPKRLNNEKGKYRSAFSTVMTLKRREWPTPEEIQKG